MAFKMKGFPFSGSAVKLHKPGHIPESATEDQIKEAKLQWEIDALAKRQQVIDRQLGYGNPRSKGDPNLTSEQRSTLKEERNKIAEEIKKLRPSG